MSTQPHHSGLEADAPRKSSSGPGFAASSAPLFSAIARADAPSTGNMGSPSGPERSTDHEASAAPSIMSRSMRQCLKFVDYAVKNSPRVNALLRKIEAKGCSLALNPIVCEDVFEGAAAIGAYDAVTKRVVMNPSVPERYLTQHQYTRGITHELIHAYDDCRVDMRQDNPKHMACTEIRAANLSGDCDYSDELKRTGFRFELAGVQQKCVKKRTLQSLKMHQACAGMTPAQIEGVIDDVWKPCYEDTAPFPTN